MPWILRLGVSLVLGAWCLVFLAPRASAADSLPSNRYLLIVETSRSMQARADGIRKTIEDLLGSGVGGQLQRGDSIGFWTFDQEVRAGEFPLQTWIPETQKGVVGRVLAFLKQQKFENKGKLDKVLPGINHVINNSDFITIILITAGEQDIHGMEFDKQINDFYKLWRDKQRKAQMPFVTVLTAAHGKLTHFALSTPPWKIDMPPLPEELVAAAEAQKKAVGPAPPPRTSTVAPLIVIGKKPQPQPVAPVTPATPEASTVQTQRIAMPPEVAEKSSPNPAPAAPVTSTTNKLAAPAPPPKAPPIPPDSTNTPTNPVSAVPLVARAEPEVKNPTPEKSVSPESAALAPASKPPSGPATGPVATAPPPTALGGKLIWIATGVLILVAGAIAVVLLRRPKSAPPASLITRSFERDKP